ncbi:uncharacterized protein [Primulina eburnea]|uniref:uncharacterized protein n=1 Tax=Primulina eburnea TaxID=1245227 RepID=UPI003C6BEC98
MCVCRSQPKVLLKLLKSFSQMWNVNAERQGSVRSLTASIIGVAVVLAGQTLVDMSLRLLKGGKHVLQEKLAVTGGFHSKGVHFVAGLRMLVGCEITSVSALTSHVDGTLPPPDHISSTIQLENGSSGVFVMVVSSKSPKVLWRVVGLKGTIQVERGNIDLMLFTGDGGNKSWFYPFSGVTEELKTF